MLWKKKKKLEWRSYGYHHRRTSKALTITTSMGEPLTSIWIWLDHTANNNNIWVSPNYSVGSLTFTQIMRFVSNVWNAHNGP